MEALSAIEVVTQLIKFAKLCVQFHEIAENLQCFLSLVEIVSSDLDYADKLREDHIENSRGENGHHTTKRLSDAIERTRSALRKIAKKLDVCDEATIRSRLMYMLQDQQGQMALEERKLNYAYMSLLSAMQMQKVGDEQYMAEQKASAHPVRASSQYPGRSMSGAVVLAVDLREGLGDGDAAA
ncbi:hypothetical protein G7046_g3342 [Stylonectria norvegica]|nr:hypothetical protein G7046_g3342 [Stylonectria norvegica]